jgi:hypothetical protein
MAGERNKAKELEAIISGQTKEYIDSRGGINAQGYYNDVPESQQLTAEERKSVTKPDGTIDSEAMLAILNKKEAGVNGGSTGGAGNTAGLSGKSMDAIAAINALLKSYGIGDLSAAITDAVIKGYSSDTIQLMMQDPNGKDPLAIAFQKRFPANKARLAAGKSVLGPDEYLRAERSYTQVMQSYGVSNLATRDKLNAFIENDVSATEVSDRVGLAIDRVKNADANTKAALAIYYPMLNQSDIISAVLDPAEGLPALKRKVQVAEIGGAALSQGFKATNVGGVAGIDIKMGQEALANLGVTKEEAQRGFATVAQVTPTGTFLSSISASGQEYGQLQAEQETFQNLASATKARTFLTQEELSRFGGSSGTAKGTLASQVRGSL